MVKGLWAQGHHTNVSLVDITLNTMAIYSALPNLLTPLEL